MKRFENDPHIAKILKISERMEPVLLGLVLLGFVSIAQRWPIPESVFIFSTSLLAIVFILRGTALVTPIEESFERFAVRLIHYTIAVGLLAFLFEVMGWKGWMDMGMSSIFGIIVCLAIFTIKKKSITQYLNIYELCSMLLVMLYLGKIFYQLNS